MNAKQLKAKLSSGALSRYATLYSGTAMQSRRYTAVKINLE